VNKTELVSAIAADTDLSKADAARAFDSALKHVSDALAKGEAVQLIGFGNFAVADRPERSGRNPSTGEPMIIKASKAVKFTASKSLKDAVNAAG
jgi:DNA-binding protein HU-beta